MNFTVVDHVSELRENSGATAVFIRTLFLTDLPNADSAVVATADQELSLVPKGACDARDCVRVSFRLLASKKYWAVYLHVPQPDSPILVTTCD